MTAEEPTVVFAGGGTGGHLFPGIAVAEQVLRRRPRARVVFIGSGRDVETTILRRYGFQHIGLSVEPSTSLRRAPWRFLWRNWRAVREAKRLLRQLRPSAVVGLGGFASVPVVTAACGQETPIVLLEQNAVPGRATRWLCRHASLLCLSFDECRMPGRNPVFPKNPVSFLPRTIVTGNPVRREIVALHAEKTRNVDTPAGAGQPECLSGPPAGDGRRVLLVLGGSQGAVSVNEMATAAAAEMRHDLAGWKIVHQAGAQQHAQVACRYAELGIRADVAPFFSDMASLYRSATLAVARAGATTLAELACAGCPAVLVPYPYSLGNHQWHNARYYESRGTARIVHETAYSCSAETGNANAERLACLLKELLQSPQTLERMARAMHCLARPQAAEAVADYVLNPAALGTNRRQCG